MKPLIGLRLTERGKRVLLDELTRRSMSKDKTFTEAAEDMHDQDDVVIDLGSHDLGKLVADRGRKICSVQLVGQITRASLERLQHEEFHDDGYDGRQYGVAS